jgi:hypothetical protein
MLGGSPGEGLGADAEQRLDPNAARELGTAGDAAVL